MLHVLSCTEVDESTSLKGQCHEIFCVRFFSWITFPHAPENNFRFISIFFENSRRYSQVKVHHLCQWHRWQNWCRYQRPVSTTPVSTTLVANCHQHQQYRRQICHCCCWHRWQIMGTISGCRELKVNLKAKIYIHVNCTTRRCPNKIIKILLLEDFFHLTPVSMTPLVHLEPWISLRIFEKNWNSRNSILRCLGETDSWKKPEVENLVTLSLLKGQKQALTFF